MTGKGIVEMTANSMFRKSEMEEAVRLAEKHWQHLHTIPEKAFEEKETTAYIKKVCKEYPVDFIDIGMDTGLVCFLDAGRKILSHSGQI